MAKRFWMSACLGVCSLSAFAAFAPDQARQVFGESGLNVTASTTEACDYLFMRIKWTASEDEDVSDDEQQMSAVMDALDAYLAPARVECRDSPFCKTLTKWMEPEPTYTIPDVSSCVVKDESTASEHVCVMAFDAGPLKKEKAAAAARMNAVNDRTKADWAVALKEAFGHFKTHEEKAKFNALLGCPVVTLVNQGVRASLTEVNEGSGVDEVRRILDHIKSEGSLFAKNRALSWSAVREDNADPFFPVWASEDGGRFEEAVKLFRQGKNLDRIIVLLSESLAMNPGGREKWQYLAASLKFANRFEDAIFAYVQTLRFDGKNKQAWDGLLECLRKAGCSANAGGLDWYLKIINM